jgi:hypothetical protein
MKNIAATEWLSDEEVRRLEGKHLGEDSFDLVVSGKERTVTKPNGQPLLIYRPDVLPRGLCRTAFDVFRRVDVGSQNRGMAAGAVDVSGRTRFKPKKLDGTTSNTNAAAWSPTAIVGFADRTPRNPYCRMTEFNLQHGDQFARARPFINAVDDVFKETLPDRYAAQKAAIDATSDDFKIRDTAFTTMTVNHSWQTAVHDDKGDLEKGFGVMAVLDAGKYDGGYLVFPRYRVAVDMRAGGVCLADVHEFHGNTPILGVEGRYLRCSLVFYMRERMTECGTVQEESLRAREVTR